MTLKVDGLMNIIEDDNFDYRAYTRETSPDPAKILRGTAERWRRFDAAMTRLSVRLDEEVFEQFRQLTAEGQSVERLINHALREWLFAQGMKELVRV
jgi:uncharacterized protein (DUF4415 family)